MGSGDRTRKLWEDVGEVLDKVPELSLWRRLLYKLNWITYALRGTLCKHFELSALWGMVVVLSAGFLLNNRPITALGELGAAVLLVQWIVRRVASKPPRG